MKRTFLTFVALLAVLLARAQVIQYYGEETSQGSFTPITGGTELYSAATEAGETVADVLYDGTAAQKETVSGSGISLGFTFPYGNLQATQFVVGPQGYLILAGEEGFSIDVPSGSDAVNVLSSYANSLGVVLRCDITGTDSTSISYLLEGGEGDHTMTVQWRNILFKHPFSWSDTFDGEYDVQVRLHESGKIEFTLNNFKPFDDASTNYMFMSIGLRGDVEGDVLTLSDSYSGGTVSPGDRTTITYNATSWPADGITYTWTPPEECTTPTAQPAGDVTLTATSTSLEGSFVANGEADHYLVLLNRDGALTELPADQTVYAAGDSLGDARVLAYTTGTEFSTGDVLAGATQYYVHILSANSSCLAGPKYFTESPLTASVTTLAAAPEGLTANAIDTVSVKVGVTTNAAGNDVLVAYSAESATNDWGYLTNDGAFGTPAGELNVGDSIEGGGVVVYKGASSDNITVDGLNPSSLAHFKAWTVTADNIYSSTSLTANTLTAGIEPWQRDFTQMASGEAPVGWEEQGGWAIDYNRSGANTSVSVRSEGDPTNGTDYALTTPWIYLGEGTNRAIIDVLMTQYVMWSNGPYTLTDDTLKVQVSTDGENYTTVAAYGKDELKFADTETPVRLYAAFTEGAGQKAKVRFLFRDFGSPTITISDFRLEEKAACDYPVNVAGVDSLIVGGEIVVDWKSQGDEDAWEVRYRKAGAEAWSEPVVARQHPFAITGLEGLTSYEVQVRARCSATQKSVWSETATVRSGLAVPFTEDFTAESDMPAGWEVRQGTLATPTVMEEGEDFTFRSSRWSGSYLQFSESGEASNDWLVSPQFDLGSEGLGYVVSLELLNQGVARRKTAATDTKVQVVMARDGETFNEADTILTITQDSLPGQYDQKVYTAPLKGYGGTVRLGIYVSSSDGVPPVLLFYNLGVQYSCVNDADSFQVADTTETSARVTWTGTVDEWLVACRAMGDSTALAWQTVGEPAVSLTGLEKATAYDVFVTKSCEPGDTARVAAFSFVTPGTICLEPADIAVAVKPYSATLSWTGQAQAYNVRYREAGTEEWIAETASDTVCAIDNLEPATLYEFQLQSQCTINAADTSGWTPVDTFATAAEVVATPVGVDVTPSYASAVVTWTGNAPHYIVACRQADAMEWTEMVADDTTAVLEGLQSETSYKVRVRAYNEEGDTSRWSANVDFTTTAIPECVTPYDLTVSDLTTNGALLSWSADEGNLSWNLRWRESSASAWNEEDSLTAKEYRLEGLKDNTTYIWRVMAQCEANQSRWASQQRFSTVVDNISGVGAGDITVFVSGHTLNVVNPSGAYIRDVQVYTTGGKLVAVYRADTNDNVFLRLSQRGTVVVRVNTAGKAKTAKVMLR